MERQGVKRTPGTDAGFKSPPMGTQAPMGSQEEGASYRNRPQGCRQCCSGTRGRISRLWRAVAIGSVVLLPNASEPASAATASLAEEILSDPDFQTELPVGGPEALPETFWFDLAAFLRKVLEALAEWLALPDGFGAVGQLLLWVLAFAGAALLILYLSNELPSLVERLRGKRDWDDLCGDRLGVDPSLPIEEGASPRQADRLARDGYYREAVHVLLLCSLEELRRSLGAAFPESLTSREILEVASMSEPVRLALAPIVTVVELSHFGGRASNEAEYQACRRHFLQLAGQGSGTA